MEGGDAVESPAKEGEGVAEGEEFEEASGMEGECSYRGDLERERGRKNASHTVRLSN